MMPWIPLEISASLDRRERNPYFWNVVRPLRCAA